MAKGRDMRERMEEEEEEEKEEEEEEEEGEEEEEEEGGGEMNHPGKRVTMHEEMGEYCDYEHTCKTIHYPLHLSTLHITSLPLPHSLPETAGSWNVCSVCTKERRRRRSGGGVGRGGVVGGVGGRRKRGRGERMEGEERGWREEGGEVDEVGEEGGGTADRVN